jgi:hypothetical protein
MQIKCGGLMAAINAAGYGAYDIITWNGMMCQNPATLPIILESFQYENNHFNWNTLSELNNDYFTIEKSYDNETWEEVALIPSLVNTTSSLTNYNLRYENAEFQTTYFRLSQVDFDGTQVYFDPIVVEPSHKQDIQLFPNPSIDGILTYKSEIEISSYNVVDFSGKIVYKGTNFLNQIDLSLFESGLYQLNFFHKNGMSSHAKVVRL